VWLAALAAVLVIAGPVGCGEDDEASPQSACNGSAALCERRLDQVTFPATHNSFSASDEPGWYFANQRHGIERQLRDGIRGLLIDIHWGKRDPSGDLVRTDLEAEGSSRNKVARALPEPALRLAQRLAGRRGIGSPRGRPRLYLCHTLCELGAEPLSAELGTIRRFLDTHRGEVLMVVVEPYVPVTAIEDALRDANLLTHAASLRRDQQLPTLGAGIGLALGGPIGALLGGVAGHVLIDREGAPFGKPPRDVLFTMGLVALAAKMTKADGVVVDVEVKAFEQVVNVPADEHERVKRLFELAMQTTDGFEAYARQIGTEFKEEPALLEDVIDGLFHIAKADEAVHEAEYLYLKNVATIFAFSESEFERIAARHVKRADDPYLILKADRAMSDEELKRHYRKMVAENHPDREIARGLPPEAVKIATERLAAINAAWERIATERNLR
jgi:DnaJ like chaperone protein